MKRPNPIAYLFGNPFSALVLAIGAIYLCYQWWRGETDPLVALASIIAASYAGNAFERIEKYRLWKREWDAMEGRVSDPPFARVLRSPVLRLGIGLSIWCVFAYIAITKRNQPNIEVAAILFWIGTAVIILGWAYRLLRRNRSRKPAIQDVPVTVCVSVPHQSPSVGQAKAALPDYCLSLLQRAIRSS